MEEWRVQRKIEILRYNFIQSWFELGNLTYDQEAQESECLRSMLLVAEVTSHLKSEEYEVWQEVKKRIKEIINNRNG